ncbi:Blue copper protein [Actinidia chinensis var. chinensis]|uniref:Blue copper protein n=1 Tax=Actinidia chinensis var. chinensis TaxID=1590841 RepID=A0A2R6QYB3_ACTCC|nr:Blue copper protein [Actinidia chinensis var. chinensis]
MASYGGGIVCVFIVLCVAVPSLATVYNVGESSGWTVGVDYTNWTSGKTFVVGDSLVFNYGSGHTVDEVSGSDYNTCTIGNSNKTDNSGTTTLLLNTAGTHYYICGVIGHCGSGMKLAVTVADGGVTAAPSESPPPTTTALPPPVTFTSPPGSVLPQPSKSVTLSPFVAVVTAWVAFFKFVLL